MQANKNNSANSTATNNKSMKAKTKRKCNSTEDCKKKNIKQKNVNKSAENIKELRKVLDHQIAELKLDGENEIPIIYKWYKTDGDYRFSEELPPFSSLSTFAENINKNNCFYDQPFNTQTTMPKNSKDIAVNSYCTTFNENQMNKNLNHNLSKSTEISLGTNNETQNCYSNKTFFHINNNSMNCDIQPYSNINTSNEMQNFSRSNETISDATKNFVYGYREGYVDRSNANDKVFYNTDLNAQYENPQQHPIDLSIKRGNITSVNGNSNYKLSNHDQPPIYDPQIANVEQYDVKENSFMSQYYHC